MAEPVGALLIVIAMATSGSPSTVTDGTVVMTQPFVSMQACTQYLIDLPALGYDGENRIRTLRSCVRPGEQFTYNWATRQSTSDGDAVVQSGTFRGR